MELLLIVGHDPLHAVGVQVTGHLLQIKAACFALDFGAEPLTQAEAAAFADCFVTWEERTSEDTEEAVLVPVPLEDLDQVWARLEALSSTGRVIS